MSELKEAVIVYLPEKYAHKLRRLAEAEMLSLSAAGRKYLVMMLNEVEEPE